MKAAARRRKGIRIEAEIVARHKALGVHPERYPLSGASRFRGSGHDVDIYLFGRDAAPLFVKSKLESTAPALLSWKAGLVNTLACFYAATMPTRWSVCHGRSGRVLLHG